MRKKKKITEFENKNSIETKPELIYGREILKNSKIKKWE